MNQPSLDPSIPVGAGVGWASECLGAMGYQRRSPTDLAADAAATPWPTPCPILSRSPR